MNPRGAKGHFARPALSPRAAMLSQGKPVGIGVVRRAGGWVLWTGPDGRGGLLGGIHKQNRAPGHKAVA